jgi:hypothetical protein
MKVGKLCSSMEEGYMVLEENYTCRFVRIYRKRDGIMKRVAVYTSLLELDDMEDQSYVGDGKAHGSRGKDMEDE